MPYVDVGGLALHFERYGRGPIPILLIHGNFASARWWTLLVRYLRPDYSAFAVDLRGCGESDHPPDGFGIPRLAYDVHLLAERLRLRRYHVVGHSLGGAVALQMSLDHPRAVRTLTLLAPSPSDGLDGLKQGEGETARLIKMWDPQHKPSMSVFSVLLQWSRATGVSRRRVGESLRGLMPSAALDDEDVERLIDDAEQLNPQTVIGFYRALHRWNVRDRLHEVRLPTQVIGGGLDQMIPQEALTIFAGHMPRARLDIWSDVGHSPQIEAPERLADTIDQFIYAHSWRLRLRRWWRRPPVKGPPTKSLPAGKGF